MTDIGRRFYRLVESELPTTRDFLPARLLGKPLRDLRYRREWSEGVSVYDDLPHAVNRALAYRGNVGTFVATLVVTPDDRLEIAQTSKDLHHFTIFATPFELYGPFQGPTVSIWRSR